MKKYIKRGKKVIQLTNKTDQLNYEQKYNLLVAFIRGLEINVDESNVDSQYAQGVKDVLGDITQHIERLENS